VSVNELLRFAAVRETREMAFGFRKSASSRHFNQAGTLGTGLCGAEVGAIPLFPPYFEIATWKLAVV